MYTCKIENKAGNTLVLTQNEGTYQVIKIDGLNPPNANINASVAVGMDGSRFNSSRLENRNIVILLKINGDAEANRIALYKFFVTKEWCRFWYKNGIRDVYAEGYIQTVEVTPFSNAEVMQVSILCPFPYFKDSEEITSDVSKTEALFEFPFFIDGDAPIPISEYDDERVTEIVNDSESESGVMVEAEILSAVNTLTIKDVDTGDTMELHDEDGFLLGDVILIDTNMGEKSVKLRRNGVESNIIRTVKPGFKFFKLTQGINRFSYIVDGGEVRIRFFHRKLYRGV